MDNLHSVITSSLSLPVDSYIYSLVPARQGLGVIASDDSLYVLDRETLKVLPGGQIPHIHDGVTCLKGFDVEGNLLATAGRDGRVEGWDLRSQKPAIEFKNCASLCEECSVPALTEVNILVASAVPILSLCCSPSSSMVAGGTEFTDQESSVAIWFVCIFVGLAS